MERKEMQINLAERVEIRELGSGGFGQTTLYEDAQRRRFVLKTFNPKGSNDSPKALALFKAECDRLKEVGSHNQIPSYLGFEESQGKYAIAQQYIPGSSLRQLLDEEGMFSPTQALKLLEQLLDPLAHLHQNKIIHRDIKPDNIIISLDSNLPVIVDFGAAKLVSETVLAQTGTVIGTANYAAPEQMAGQTCFQSDIYSLGLTIIELITGIKPFEQIDMHTGESVWFAKSNGVSERFAAILDKMTTRFLRDRYQSVEEIRDALYNLRQFTDQQIQEQQEKAERWRSRKRFVLRRVMPTVAAVGIAGAGGIGLWNVVDEPVAQFVKETSEKVFPKPESKQESTSADETSVLPLLNAVIGFANFIAVLGAGFGILRIARAANRGDDMSESLSLVVLPILMLIFLNTVGKFILGDLSLQEVNPSPTEQSIQE